MEIDQRVAGYLGRVLREVDDPVGTCFQVVPGVMVTGWHVLDDDLGAAWAGAVVAVDPLQGGDARDASVVGVDAVHDLAVLALVEPLADSVAAFAASDEVDLRADVNVTGFGKVEEDPNSAYRYLDAPGKWAGGTTRDGVRLGRLRTKDALRGMSGAPVLCGDRVVGVVSGRYNSAGWMRDSVWVARTEDLAPLLAGLTGIQMWGRDRAEAVEYPEVVNALAGWLTACCTDDVLGDAPQRAFREVVSDAIGRVSRCPSRARAADRRTFLASALVERRERLEEPPGVPNLAAAVHALIDSHEDASTPPPVPPSDLAEVLITEINLGVLDNVRAGGQLVPLAGEANFAEHFALDEQLRAAREMILVRLDATGEELRARGAAITIDSFIGRWRPLRAGYLDPTEKRAAIAREPFTGRAWLVREIDAFIADHDRGYFFVQADAGSGKTAFALWYSGLDRRPIHFTEYSADARTTESAVRNLAAQLIMLRGLDDLVPAGHLPERADWSSWMRQVLTAAAQRRDDDPIVLVVDGLDEADEHDVDHLPFGLPDDLPRGVYVVATVRTGSLPHQPKQPAVVCDWNRRAAQQQADLRAFIAETVALRLMTALLEDGLTPAVFVEALLERCGDVWLYLNYVLEEVTSGHRRPRDVPLLPAGLEGYYHNTIERFCRQDTDAAWRVPLLATLAIAMEPLEVETLVRLAGLDWHPRVHRFLNGPLRPFCTVSYPAQTDAPGQPERFSLKHTSFAEFLSAGPDQDIGDVTEHRSENVRQWRTRFAAECRKAGHRVCDRYLTAWGGLDAGLPDLAAEPLLAQRDGGYPLRWLAGHLLASGRDDELHELMACGPQNRNVWYVAHESAGEPMGFLNDVAMARQSLDRPVDARAGALPKPDVVSRKIRYALVDASVATASTNITPDLLWVLVDRGKWSPTRALGTVERMTDEHQRAQALLRIVDERRATFQLTRRRQSGPADSIPDSLVPEAWAIALALRQEHTCRAITALIPRLPDDLLDGAVQAVAERARQPDVLAAAAALVDRLPVERLNNFPWAQIPTMAYDEKMVINALVVLKRGHTGAAEEALEYLVERVDSEFARCQYLAVLVPRLPASAFNRAMTVLADCRARYRSDALLALARDAPVDHLTDLLDLAADTEWEDTPPEAEPRPWLRLMQELGRRPLPGPDQEASALAVAHALRADRCAEAIETLAPYLTTGSARKALQGIEADRFRWGCKQQSLMITVGALAKRLPPAEARDVVERHVREYCHVDDELRVVLQPPNDDEPAIHEAELLAPAAAHLPRDTVRLVLRSVCHGISWDEFFATKLTPALSHLAPTVGDDPLLVGEAFAMILKPSVWRPASRLTVLSVLGPYLDDDSFDKAITLVLPGPVEEECFAATASLGRELPEEQRAALARRALDAAFEISNDGQRTRAVAALAPTLPADVAEEALEFVGSVSRSVTFPSVFAALDSLAPQLPNTALRRALDIFLHIPAGLHSGEIQHVTRLFERLGRDAPAEALRACVQGRGLGRGDIPKYSAVWVLAPFLPARVAEEALVVARAARDDSVRLVSMAALASRLPDGLRAAVAREVLELLDVPPDDVSIRIAVLARLAAATSTDEVTAACQHLIASLRPVDLYDFHDSWHAFSDLMTHLPVELIDVALRFSTGLSPDRRCRVIRMLVPRLPNGLVADLVGALESVSDERGMGERARALIALAARVPGEGARHRILEAVLDHMVQRRWWGLLGPALVELIPLLGPSSRSRAVAAAVRQCFDQHRFGKDEPESLLDVLEGVELDFAFDELGRIRDPHARARTTAAILRRAGELDDPSTVFQDVDVIGRWPSTGSRGELLTIVGASAWWIRRHGGDRAVAATADAVFDVSRWWR